MRKYILALAALLASLIAASTATAEGPTSAELQNAGWTCFRDPAAPRMVCSDPGHGRPAIADPNPPPSYNFKLFTLDGAFIGTAHLIRGDLYQGEPCPQTGSLYFYIAAINYYRCEHF